MSAFTKNALPIQPHARGVAGLMAGLRSAMIRPQSFTVLCFARVLFLVRTKEPDAGRLAAIALVAAFWQNTHPPLAIGVVAVGSLAAAAWFDKLFHRAAQSPWPLTIAVLVLALAQLATPMEWRVFQISAENHELSGYLHKIDEWMPPWHASVRDSMLDGDHG